MRIVALDLSARKIDFCEIFADGTIERGVVRSLSALSKWIGPNTKKARVAFEASREAWHVAKTLKEWGHDPVMVDTTRVKQLGVGNHGRKNDAIDVEKLARALHENRIPQAHILSEHRQQLRMHQGVRRGLVQTRAQYVAMVRELLRSLGELIAGSTTEHFIEKVEAAKLTDTARGLVSPLIATLKEINRQIATIEQKIVQLCEQEQAIALLCTAPGVGLVIASAFVSVVDEAKRFKRAHQLESYLGLVPKEHSTGGKQRLGGISKAGNPYLRSMLVQAGWVILRAKPDDPLTRWGLTIAEKRGKRIAIIAIARRLAGILWAMWRDNRAYDPRVLASASVDGLDKAAESAQFRAASMKRAAAKLARRKRSWDQLQAA